MQKRKSALPCEKHRQAVQRRIFCVCDYTGGRAQAFFIVSDNVQTCHDAGFLVPVAWILPGPVPLQNDTDLLLCTLTANAQKITRILLSSC